MRCLTFSFASAFLLLLASPWTHASTEVRSIVGTPQSEPMRSHHTLNGQIPTLTQRPFKMAQYDTDDYEEPGSERWEPGIDAVLNWGNGKAYLLLSEEYIRFDIARDRADSGYPSPINHRTWPGVWRNGVDAAVNWGNGKAYLFRDNEYIRYDIASDRADPGYPKRINDRTWPGLWRSGVDAAVNWGNGKAYFFRGDEYIRFDIARDRADPGYPRPINSETWPGLGTLGPIDAAVNWGNGKAYLFSGSQYVRFDILSDRADAGYPQPINGRTWPGVWPLGEE